MPTSSASKPPQSRFRLSGLARPAGAVLNQWTHRQWTHRSEHLVLAGLVLFVGVVSLLPMARLLLEGLAPGGNLDFGLLGETLRSRSAWRATWRSLESGVGGTLVSLLLGSSFALLVALTDIRGKVPLVFCFMLPMMIPPQITALSWAQLFGPSSPLLNTVGLAPPTGTELL